jgi:hypothetical protein
VIFEESAYLAHYGILRKSGRYPWGSGETQSARNRSFLDTVESMRKTEGMSEVEIARVFGMKVTELRALKSIATNEQKLANIAEAQKLKDKGLSTSAIGRQMGLNESSVRNLLAPGAAERADILQQTADMLRRNVAEKGYIDIGTGVGNQLGISETRLKTAVAMLEEEGYRIYYPKVPQLGTNHETSLKVLGRGDVTPKEAYAAMKEDGGIKQIQEVSYDQGRSGFSKFQPPISIHPDRVAVKYKEDGGDQADGVIYVRPGKEDISLGKANYAQVRIQVGDGHYLKGMAIYKDDLPDGVDLQFNTNKSDTGNKLDAMKPLKVDKATGLVDKDLPFGSIVRQLPKLNPDGSEIKDSVRSAMNIVNDEGTWDKWSRNLSTQFLSKQKPELAQEQLALTYERKKTELENIKALTNPAVRKKLLDSYADDADSSSYRLKAQALPRQRTQVILPISTLKDNEIYAPNFRPGERVVLVRHPHGGTFEIPELTVTDKNPEARKILGFGDKASKDAVGINHRVAAHLSGADFDGDTVLVIPNNAGKVRTDRALEGLKGFDPQALYKLPPDAPKMSAQTKQKQMGLVSNLITDMTIHGATHTELAAAVRHSMVVIDAEKHHLDYKRSARENGIPALMKKYQGSPTGGASTLISQAKQDIKVDARKGRSAAEGGSIDRATGKRMYTPTGETYVDRKTGQTVVRKQDAKRILELDSARELSSGTRIENIYADHSDRMRALANEARKEFVNTKPIPYSPSAKVTYAPQVRTLNDKLNIALQNAPRERQAQVAANAIVAAKKAANPDLEKAELKKIKAQALAAARARTGANKERVHITDEEWAAIQAGAISNNRLEQILANADVDRIKELATPRTPSVMTSIMQSRAKSMLASGYGPAEVADALGVPLSTLKSSVIDGK